MQDLTLEPDLTLLRKAYPRLDQAQLERAAENLRRYIELALRIHERQCGKLSLTAAEADHTIAISPGNTPPTQSS